MTEDVRLSPKLIARRCACRGWIVADEKLSPTVGAKVSEHQASERHQSWDLGDWIEQNTPKIDVPIALLKKVG